MSTCHTLDDGFFQTVRNELFVAVVGDVLDKMGLQHQFLAPSIKLLNPDSLMLGRAMPVLEADYFGDCVDGQNPLSHKSFGYMLEALDDLRLNEVYICAGASHRYALWGGLMSVRAMNCGAAGAVVHGFHRDSREIARLGFPLASIGAYAQDQAPRGKVVDWRIPIEMDGVRIHPGDIIFGDCDGVLVIPTDAAQEAFAHAVEKVRGEKVVLKALQDGMSASEAFATYGVM